MTISQAPSTKRHDPRIVYVSFLERGFVGLGRRDAYAGGLRPRSPLTQLFDAPWEREARSLDASRAPQTIQVACQLANAPGTSLMCSGRFTKGGQGPSR